MSLGDDGRLSFSQQGVRLPFAQNPFNNKKKTVRLSLYVYCMHVCVYVYVRMYVCTYTYVRTYTYVCIRTYVYCHTVMKYCHTSRAPNVVDGTCFARLGGLYMIVKCTSVAITL